MDDRDLRPRHHRNPAMPERVLDLVLYAFCFSIGGLVLAGYARTVFDVVGFLAS